jgi:hypothetical protein
MRNPPRNPAQHASATVTRRNDDPQAAREAQPGDRLKMGRVGLEPTTNRLKAECSTS